MAYCEAGKSIKEIGELMELRATQIKARKETLNARGYVVNSAQTAGKEAPEEAAVEVDMPENIRKTESAGAAIDPLEFLYNCLPGNVKRLWAAVCFVDGAGNAWKLELTREN